MYKFVSSFITGSQRGYICVADQGVEGDYKPIPKSLKGERGNFRWAMQRFKEKGATHYTVTWKQGVPGKGYSYQYCYIEYTGYEEV